MDGDHLVDEVSRVKHGNPNKPLDDELRLEQILAFFRQTLQRQHEGVLVVNSPACLKSCSEGDQISCRLAEKFQMDCVSKCVCVCVKPVSLLH